MKNLKRKIAGYLIVMLIAINVFECYAENSISNSIIDNNVEENIINDKNDSEDIILDSIDNEIINEDIMTNEEIEMNDIKNEEVNFDENNDEEIEEEPAGELDEDIFVNEEVEINDIENEEVISSDNNEDVLEEDQVIELNSDKIKEKEDENDEENESENEIENEVENEDDKMDNENSEEELHGIENEKLEENSYDDSEAINKTEILYKEKEENDCPDVKNIDEAKKDEDMDEEIASKSDTELQNDIIENKGNDKIDENCITENVINDVLASISNTSKKTDGTEVNYEDENDNNQENKKLFGASGVEHILKRNWINSYNINKSITKITIKKGGSIPSGTKYVIDSTTNLSFYKDGTEIVIFAPNPDDIIYTPEDASYLFSCETKKDTLDNPLPLDQQNWFVNLLSIEGIENLNTSRTKNMSFMFFNDHKLNNLVLDDFDTSLVENMKAMFNSCQSLSTLDISMFDTEKVKSMEQMFYGCYELTNLNVDRINTSNVENMNSMFGMGWGTNVGKITNLNLSSFDTRNVINMQGMFCGNSFSNIDLTSFDTNNVTNMLGMFDGCGNLATIYVSENFKTNSLISPSTMYMFQLCTNLKGEKGSQCDGTTAKSYATFAHIDEGVSNPGYFSTKKYEVNFDMQGHGVQIASQSVTKNSKVVKPASPSETGYIFKGWYKEDTFENLWDFENDEVIDDTILYAKWVEVFDVTFDMQGHGVQVASQIVEEGEKIVKPTTPSEAGYVFKGWYKENTFSNLWDFENDVVNSTTVLYAKWLQIYEVTFDMQGHGAQVTSQIVEEGEKIVKPTTPLEAGYVFKGWYKENTFSNLWDFENDVVNLTTVLYAKWLQIYEVTFDMQGHGTQVLPLQIENGSKINKPLDPSAEGYSFKGWYKENTFNNKWNFNVDIVTTATVLYAKWEENRYNIIYNKNGGEWVTSFVATTSRLYHENVIYPIVSNINKTGYDFMGWYDNAGCTGVATLSIPANTANNSEVWAKWDIKKFSVDFNTDGGSIVPTQTIEYNKTVSVPIKPTKTGYVFISWYTENSPYTNIYNFSSKVTNSFTLYARFIHESQIKKVSFNTNGGNVIEPQSVVVGEKVLRPDDPKKSGYTFVNWYKNKELTSLFDFNSVVNSDIIIYAKWKENIAPSPYPHGGGSGGGGGGGGGGGDMPTSNIPITYANLSQDRSTTAIEKDNVVWEYNALTNEWKLGNKSSYGDVSFVTYGFWNIVSSKTMWVDNVLKTFPVIETYFINDKGVMTYGWLHTLDNYWYFFDTDYSRLGIMVVSAWKYIDGYWYYFGEDGKMLVDTITPDGYKVDSTGKYVN